MIFARNIIRPVGFKNGTISDTEKLSQAKQGGKDKTKMNDCQHFSATTLNPLK